MQPTAWIPLLDANESNGCMQVEITIILKFFHLLSSVKLKRAQPIDNFCDVNFAVDGQRAQNRKSWHPPVLPWRHVVRDARGRRNEEDVR